MIPTRRFLPLLLLLFCEETKADSGLINFSRVINFGPNVFHDFHVDVKTGNIYTVNNQFRVDMIDPWGQTKTTFLEPLETGFVYMSVCVKTNVDNELVVIGTGNMTAIYTLDSRDMVVKNTNILRFPLAIQNCKMMQFIGWSSADNSLTRFDSSGQVLWKTVLAGGFVPPATFQSGLSTILYKDSAALLQTIDYNTGNMSGRSDLKCQLSFVTSTATVTQASGILLCQVKEFPSGFFFTQNSLEYWLSGKMYVDVVSVAEKFTVVSTKDIYGGSLLIILHKNLTVAEEYQLPVGWVPQKLVASEDAFYFLTIVPTKIKFLNIWILPGLRILQFNFLSLLKPVVMASTTRYISEPSQTIQATVLATNAGSSSLVLILVPVITAIVLLVLAVDIIVMRRKKMNGQKQIGTPIMTSTGATRTNYADTQVTLFTTIIPLAIPGYMEVQKFDFRPVQLTIKGSGGAIFKGQLLSGQLMAANQTDVCIIKCPADRRQLKIASKRNHFYREVALHHHLNNISEFFAKLIGYESSTLTILMKYYSMGSMKTTLKNPEFEWTKSIVHSCMSDVAHGLQCMHRLGFSHCDIKPDNILMEYQESKKRVVALITDLGISLVVNDTSMGVEQFRPSTIFGFSLHYAAPELLLIRKLESRDTRSPDVILAGDIYAYSLVLYQTLHHTNSIWT